MTPFLYALNVGTLATWLSVAGFGTVGIAVPLTMEIIQPDQKKDPYSDLEAIALTEDFSSSTLPASQETDTGSTGELGSDQTEVPFAEQETLPTPPEIPEVAEVTPLPEIPDMPTPSPTSADVPSAAPTKVRPVPRTNSKTATRSNMPTSATGGSPKGKVGATGKAGNGGMNGGSGMSDSKRLAGGRMPAPSYPAEARTKGQTGTVVVEFVVGENGNVTSAYAKTPSPWPLLNEKAVSSVRSWKFPPGGVTKCIRPITFKLN